MFITCQQCSTMFRLDENRLKPQGSKVRCSQCGNLFIATPPATVDVQPPVLDEPAGQFDSPPASEAAVDRELEGIDLAELDSILERDRALNSVDDDLKSPKEEIVEFDEADLDFDFESALEGDEETDPVDAAEVTAPAADELDLDMDFDLDSGEMGAARAETAEGALPEDSVFEAAADSIDLTAGGLSPAEDIEAGEGDLTEDVELALDGFEEALSLTDDAEPVIEDEASEEVAAEQPPEAGALGLDDDLGDLDAFLGEDGAEQEQGREETELSLDEGGELSAGQGQGLELAPGFDATAADAGHADDDLGIDDFGALLEKEEFDQEPEEREEVELSLDDDAGTSPPSESGAAEDAAGDVDTDDLGLDDFGDLDDLLDDKSAGQDQETEDLALDDLGDLDGLLDDEEPESESDMEQAELSLSDDTELSLDEEAPGESAVASAADDGEFDLSDFDSLLDEEDTADEAPAEELELSLDDEPALELASGAASKDEAFAADEGLLDLSDLDDGPDEDVLPDQDTEEVELSLDLDDASEEISGVDQDQEIGELEELEFELDAEFEDKPVSQTADLADHPKVDEELDLTDIEQMLEDDTIVSETIGLSDEAAGDDGGTERWVDDLETDDDGELDLTEIEEAIDAADSEFQNEDALDIEEEELALDFDQEKGSTADSAAPVPDELELELELEMEDDSEPDATAKSQEEADVLDISDLEFSIEDESPSMTTETMDAGDIELEFEIDETGPAGAKISEEDTLVASQSVRAATATVEDDLVEEAFSLDETVTAQPAMEKPPARPVKAAKKKGSSKFLVVLLILAMLGGGGYYGYDYIIKNDIQIPYLSDYINPKPKDPSGVMNLTTLEINSKFIENQKAGRLFIVTGKVRNGYTVPCTMIRMRGKLFTKGKKLAKTAQSYAGVTIPDQELANEELAGILQRLKSPLAQSKSVQVAPGQTVPFMVVFSQLPDDLDEFAIELVSSTKVQ